MKRLLPLIGLGLMCAGCSAQAINYKEMTDWPLPSCMQYAKNTSDDRTLIKTANIKHRLMLEACALNPQPEEGEYEGPIAIRIINVQTGEVLKEEKWETYQSPVSAGNQNVDGQLTFTFSGGARRFSWSVDTASIPSSSPTALRVLDYQNCTTQTTYANMQGTKAYVFEGCYTAAEGSPGVLRLSAYPEGKELKVQTVKTLALNNIHFLYDEKVLRFENAGQTVTWELAK